MQGTCIPFQPFYVQWLDIFLVFARHLQAAGQRKQRVPGRFLPPRIPQQGNDSIFSALPLCSTVWAQTLVLPVMGSQTNHVTSVDLFLPLKRYCSWYLSHRVVTCNLRQHMLQVQSSCLLKCIYATATTIFMTAVTDVLLSSLPSTAPQCGKLTPWGGDMPTAFPSTL